jgi:hypothetical protein
VKSRRVYLKKWQQTTVLTGVFCGISVTELEVFESGTQFSLDILYGVGRKAQLLKERQIKGMICWLAFWILLPAQRNVKINSDE